MREVQKNIVEQVTENYIIKFLQDYIKSLPNDYYYDNNEQFDKNYLIELLSVLNERNLDNVLHNLEHVVNLNLIKTQKIYVINISKTV